MLIARLAAARSEFTRRSHRTTLPVTRDEEVPTLYVVAFDDNFKLSGVAVASALFELTGR